MFRVALMVLGWLFFVIGVIGMLTPIPFGIFFLVLSMLLLIPNSPGTVRLIRRLRAAYPRFDRVMQMIIQRAPSPYRRILRRTEVDVLYSSDY